MSEYCYICGRELSQCDCYFTQGPNTYYCDNPECIETAKWDLYAARYAVDPLHHPVIDGVAYELRPNCHGGAIKFYNGKKVPLNGIAFYGDVPEKFKNIIKDNAEFVN